MADIKLEALNNFEFSENIIENITGGAIEGNTCYIIFILLLIIGGWVIYRLYKWLMSSEFYSNCSKKIVGPVEVESCH